jgi:hypothetical protein
MIVHKIDADRSSNHLASGLGDDQNKYINEGRRGESNFRIG